MRGISSAPPPPLLVGGGGAVTVIFTDCAAVVPSPLHVRVNVVSAVSAGLVKLPLTFCEPLQPADPSDAIQVSVSALVQLRWTMPPDATVEASVSKLTLGPGMRLSEYVPALSVAVGVAMKLTK
jgi:hypothetical protein